LWIALLKITRVSSEQAPDIRKVKPSNKGSFLLGWAIQVLYRLMSWVKRALREKCFLPTVLIASAYFENNSRFEARKSKQKFFFNADFFKTQVSSPCCVEVDAVAADILNCNDLSRGKIFVSIRVAVILTSALQS
jgi:hypothetical protein